LTHRIISTASALLTGEARPRPVLKTVILSKAEYDCATKD
jgi:hypothetical protein